MNRLCKGSVKEGYMCWSEALEQDKANDQVRAALSNTPGLAGL